MSVYGSGFADAVGANEKGGRTQSSKEQLKMMLMSQFEHLEDGAVLSRVADVFDTDGSGKVDFREFALSMNMLVRGGVDEKVSFILMMHDTNHDGKLEARDMLRLKRRYGDRVNWVVINGDDARNAELRELAIEIPEDDEE